VAVASSLLAEALFLLFAHGKTPGKEPLLAGNETRWSLREVEITTGGSALFNVRANKNSLHPGGHRWVVLHDFLARSTGNFLE